jgi:hypothetical protein
MNRHFEQKYDGFVVSYKKSKFHVGGHTNIKIEDMSDSIYDATVWQMSVWDIWELYVNKFNEVYGENVITMEKISKLTIIETENMFG